MVIGIEAERANNPQKTGVEHYAKQLILHLAALDSQNSYVLYLRTPPEKWFAELPKNFAVKLIPFPIFWTQIRLSLEMLLHPVDVLFIPASALPLVHPKKSVITIHDLAWKFYPQAFTPFMRNFLKWSTSFAVRRASKIIAVSQSTAGDLAQFYPESRGKTVVVHHGWEEGKSVDQSISKSVAQLLPDRYVLFLSTLQPRKNLEGLIDAFNLLKNENPELPQKLVVVGRQGWKFENILQKIQDNQQTVIYLDHVSDENRFKILAGADLMVLPSFYEGFGMQILESFAAGVPVAVSNTSSLPEVAGQAAVYFDPRNLQEMKNAIKSVLLDKSLAESLKQKGFARLQNFSWDRCANETLAVLKS